MASRNTLARNARNAPERRQKNLIARCIAWIIWFTASCAFAEDWPHWRGMRRNDVSAESSAWTGNKDWPMKALKWQSDVGAGGSSPLVVGGRVYAFGWHQDKESLICLEARAGEPLWQQSYTAPERGRYSTGDEGLYSGPSSTPEFDPQTYFIYTLGNDGELRCWNTREKGRLVWSMNLYDRFAVKQRPKVGRSPLRDYGYTSSPLVLGDSLIVEIGAPAATLASFDKRTGQPQWQSEAAGPAGHNAGPVPIQIAGTPCVAVFSFDGLLVTRTDGEHAGKTVATFPWKTEFAQNIATVAVHHDNVLLTSGYNQNRMARLKVTLQGAELVWENKYSSKICTPVIHDGHVYWAFESIHCVDFESGALVWKGGTTGDAGSCIMTSDDRLIFWCQRGDLLLVESARRSPKRMHALATLHVPDLSDVWPHVVLSDGRLYCRDRQGKLLCFGSE
jgi:outer membrane protein assembly factor BamB